MKEYYFPKCLLPIHERPILFEIINYWIDSIDEVVIVLNRDSGEMIKEYVTKYFDKKIDIKYCYQEKKSGTFFAIKKAISISKNRNFVLNWSDILLTKKIDDYVPNSVFVTTKIPCRYKFDSEFVNMGKCVVSDTGIYGVFLIDNFPDEFYIIEDETECEVEILDKLNGKLFSKHVFENFIDIGDLQKYNQIIRISDNNRAFGSHNEITFLEDFVIKNTSNEKLKDCEQNWYKNILFDFLPKVKSYDPLILQKIKNSITLSEWLEINSCEKEWVVKEVFKLLNQIHCSKPFRDSNDEDSYYQYIQKTIDRLKRINFLFKDFENNIIINGKQYKNPIVLLENNIDKIKSIFNKKFQIIHGDLQLSNILINDKKELFVIDPRGYFGNSRLYGDAMYDYAKLYYGFCGMWDKFSKGYNNVKYINNNFILYPLIDKKELKERRKIFFEEAKKVKYLEINEFKIDLLHAIIWLSVTDYISNDVLSSLYGYLNGTILINKLFS
jgi:thiamine kinase-like enzyme